MLIPAIIYLFINYGGDAQRGWTIPIVTDIAFEKHIDYLVKAKIAIILTSVIAGTDGFLWPYVAGRKVVD